LLNTIVYYFLCIFGPIYFVLPCHQGNHDNATHIMYGIYTVFVFIFELLFSVKMKQIIADEGTLAYGFSWILSLVNSQISKLSLYTDMLYLTISYACGYYNLCVISGMFISLQMLFNLIQIIYVWIGYWNARDNKNTHYTTYINLLAKYSYNNEVKTIAEILERFSTSCTIKYKDTFIAQIIINNVVKFIIQNFPHTILQLYSMITYPEGDLRTIAFSFALSTISLFFSFIAALTTQPSICGSDMLGTISQSNYHQEFLRSKVQDKGCWDKARDCLKGSEKKKDGKIHTELQEDSQEQMLQYQRVNAVEVEKEKDDEIHEEYQTSKKPDGVGLEDSMIKEVDEGSQMSQREEFEIEEKKTVSKKEKKSRGPLGHP